MHAPAQPADREFVFGDREFALLSGIASQITGIVLGDKKRELVYGRLARRVRALGLSGFDEYIELISSPRGEAEIGMLVDAITTNLTDFFRESHHFDHLRESVLRPLIEKPAGGESRRLRIWSAGCSSGEEPYSIAMTLQAAFPSLAGWDAQILATDIATHVLKRASEGTYPDNRLKGIPRGFLERFTETRSPGARTVVGPVRSLITFKQLNLLGPWPMKGPFDGIFCRNVALYFDKETQRGLFDRFADLIAENGWLYIGHSESLYRVSERFELVGRTIYRKLS